MMPDARSVDRTRRSLLGAAACGIATSVLSGKAAAQEHALTSYPQRERRVALAYSLWHETDNWRHSPHGTWGTPELGFYRSDDPSVLARHAEWLSDAGVDFVVVDWSNDLGMDVRRPGGPATQRFIEQATVKMFDVWATQRAAPRIALMIGLPEHPEAITNGALRAKADEVHDLFVASPSRARLLQTYLGRPLLLVYVNTPSPWQRGLPPWQDDRFTVRFVTGFVTQQRPLLGPDGVSRYGYWSWEDRHRPTYSVFQGHPEAMTVVATWRGQGTPGRNDGHTYIEQWQWARKIGPRFVLAGTFNEWWTSEQADPERSKDVEPSRELGRRYMDILKEQGRLLKEGK